MENKSKGGRPSTTETARKIAEYRKHRKTGNTQKQSAILAGIGEKTAGRYEKILNAKTAETAELISLLKAKARKADTAKDLVLLTKEIDRLTEKLENRQ